MHSIPSSFPGGLVSPVVNRPPCFHGLTYSTVTAETTLGGTAGWKWRHRKQRRRLPRAGSGEFAAPTKRECRGSA